MSRNRNVLSITRDDSLLRRLISRDQASDAPSSEIPTPLATGFSGPSSNRLLSQRYETKNG